MNCIFEVTEEGCAPLYKKEETADADIRENKNPYKGRNITRVIISALHIALMAGMTIIFVL